MWLLFLLGLGGLIAHALEDDTSSYQRGNRRQFYYRTRDGCADYGFLLERQLNGTSRIYITSQPSYGVRASGAHETHRLMAGGRYYICWTGAIRDETEAMAVAARWADATQEYIRTGQRF